MYTYIRITTMKQLLNNIAEIDFIVSEIGHIVI